MNRLSRHGWRVLHSIPLADKVDVDHLLIGPGGVFTINTKHHHKKAMWVGDDAVRVDHGKSAPYARKSRTEANRVVRVLERYCAFPVPVDPVLVFVGVRDLKVVATQPTVRVYRERQVAALAPLSGVLTAEQVEQVTALLVIARLGAKTDPVSHGVVPAFPTRAAGVPRRNDRPGRVAISRAHLRQCPKIPSTPRPQTPT